MSDPHEIDEEDRARSALMVFRKEAKKSIEEGTGWLNAMWVHETAERGLNPPEVESVSGDDDDVVPGE